MRKVYLIDLENVKNAGLDGVEQLSEEESVVIFYSNKADTLKIDTIKNIRESQADVDYIKADNGTPNALDFQLITYLYYHLVTDLAALGNVPGTIETAGTEETTDSETADPEKDIQYWIISKDTGYEASIRMSKRMGLSNVHRAPAIKNAIHYGQRAEKTAANKQGNTENRKDEELVSESRKDEEVVSDVKPAVKSEKDADSAALSFTVTEHPQAPVMTSAADSTAAAAAGAISSARAQNRAAGTASTGQIQNRTTGTAFSDQAQNRADDTASSHRAQNRAAGTASSHQAQNPSVDAPFSNQVQNRTEKDESEYTVKENAADIHKDIADTALSDIPDGSENPETSVEKNHSEDVPAGSAAADQIAQNTQTEEKKSGKPFFAPALADKRTDLAEIRPFPLNDRKGVPEEKQGQGRHKRNRKNGKYAEKDQGRNGESAEKSRNRNGETAEKNRNRNGEPVGKNQDKNSADANAASSEKQESAAAEAGNQNMTSDKRSSNEHKGRSRKNRRDYHEDTPDSAAAAESSEPEEQKAEENDSSAEKKNNSRRKHNQRKNQKAGTGKTDDNGKIRAEASADKEQENLEKSGNQALNQTEKTTGRNQDQAEASLKKNQNKPEFHGKKSEKRTVNQALATLLHQKCSVGTDDATVNLVEDALLSSENKSQFYQYFRRRMGASRGSDFYRNIRDQFGAMKELTGKAEEEPQQDEQMA